VFQALPTHLHNLKQRISDDINVIPSAMLLHIMESVLDQLLQCINLHGRHLTGVSFHILLIAFIIMWSSSVSLKIINELCLLLIKFLS
jgi:hypothetical protein